MSGYTFEAAVADLEKAVQELGFQGKQLKAAGLKPRLQTLSGDEFDEKRLGFRSFGDFLRAAAEEIDGYSVQGTGLALRLSRGQEIVPIRRDLWNAFTDWKASYCWVGEDAGGAVRSDEVDSGEGIAIPQASPNIYFQTVVDFADSMPETPAKLALGGVVGGTTVEDLRPLIGYLREEFNPDWDIFRSKSVHGRISAWMTENGISAPIRSDEPDAPSPNQPQSEVLREQIHRAIDRMSLSELGDLRFPPSALS